jgi:hypothetical protein
VRGVRVNSGTGDRLVGVSVRGVRVNSGTGDRLVGVSVRGVRVNSGIGDRLVGVSVRSVRVNRGTGDRFVGVRGRGVRLNGGTGDNVVGLSVSCEGEQRYWGSFVWSECHGCEGEHSFEFSADRKSEFSSNCSGMRRENFTLHFLSKQHYRGCF